jgi:hypothetical protein
MIDVSGRIRYSAIGLMLLGAAAAIAVSAGLVVSERSGYWHFAAFFAALLVVATWAAILKNWRWGIYGLVVYIPFAGLPTILLYPAPGIVTQSKDFLFVIPTYLAFILWCHKNRQRIFFPGAPVGLLGALSGIILIQFLNPKLASPLVGLIGLKVWLFYVPLYFLGYHLVDSEKRLLCLARLMLLVAMIPSLIGIAQAVLIYTGRSDIVYSLYGSAAIAVTQRFAAFPVGTGQSLARIPGTFTFVTQNFIFLLAMLPISYAMWIGGGSRWRSNPRYLVSTGLITIAAFLSGARAALVIIPFYLLLASVLGGKLARSWRIIAMVAAGLLALSALLGASVGEIFDFTSGLTGHYLGKGGIIVEYPRALDYPWLGTGTGMSTGPARYALTSYDEAREVLVGIESFYAKVIVELGVPGLIVVLALFARLLLDGYASFARLNAPVLRGFAGALLAFLILITIYLAKGDVLQIDPLNVYFWFFAGILVKLPSLDPESRTQNRKSRPPK